jgi:hypothetical protein
MVRTGWLAAFLLTVAPWTCLAQFGGMGGMGGMGRMAPKPPEQWTVKVETFGNQSVTGKLGLDAVVVKCELGTYEIKPEKIKTIELGAIEPGVAMIVGMHGAERKGSVVTATGEKVTGTIAIPNTWRIETDLGFLTPDSQQLKTFTFIARAQADANQPDRKADRARKPGEKPNPEPSNDVKKPGEPEKSSNSR